MYAAEMSHECVNNLMTGKTKKKKHLPNLHDHGKNKKVEAHIEGSILPKLDTQLYQQCMAGIPVISTERLCGAERDTPEKEQW